MVLRSTDMGPDTLLPRTLLPTFRAFDTKPTERPTSGLTDNTVITFLLAWVLLERP